MLNFVVKYNTYFILFTQNSTNLSFPPLSKFVFFLSAPEKVCFFTLSRRRGIFRAFTILPNCPGEQGQFGFSPHFSPACEKKYILFDRRLL